MAAIRTLETCQCGGGGDDRWRLTTNVTKCVKISCVLVFSNKRLLRVCGQKCAKQQPCNRWSSGSVSSECEYWSVPATPVCSILHNSPASRSYYPQHQARAAHRQCLRLECPHPQTPARHIDIGYYLLNISTLSVLYLCM